VRSLHAEDIDPEYTINDPVGDIGSYQFSIPFAGSYLSAFDGYVTGSEDPFGRGSEIIIDTVDYTADALGITYVDGQPSFIYLEDSFPETGLKLVSYTPFSTEDGSIDFSRGILDEDSNFYNRCAGFPVEVVDSVTSEIIGSDSLTICVDHTALTGLGTAFYVDSELYTSTQLITDFNLRGTDLFNMLTGRDTDTFGSDLYPAGFGVTSSFESGGKFTTFKCTMNVDFGSIIVEPDAYSGYNDASLDAGMDASPDSTDAYNADANRTDASLDAIATDAGNDANADTIEDTLASTDAISAQDTTDVGSDANGTDTVQDADVASDVSPDSPDTITQDTSEDSVVEGPICRGSAIALESNGDENTSFDPCGEDTGADAGTDTPVAGGEDAPTQDESGCATTKNGKGNSPFSGIVLAFGSLATAFRRRGKR
jgi:hypothetical protein